MVRRKGRGEYERLLPCIGLIKDDDADYNWNQECKSMDKNNDSAMLFCHSQVAAAAAAAMVIALFRLFTDNSFLHFHQILAAV